MRAALLICVAYYIGAKVGLALTLRPFAVSTLWPPNAILLSALLLTPTRTWWAVLLAAFPAHVAAELHVNIPIGMVVTWFISNSSEALIGAGLIRWLTDGPVRFDSFRRVSIFVLAGALFAAFASSFLDAAFVALNHWGTGHYWDTWRMRVLSNALANLTLVPVIVGWRTDGTAFMRTSSPRRLVEGGLLLASLLVVCAIVFTRQAAGPDTSPALLYAPLPLLLWVAVRFGPWGTNVCLLTVALLAIWGATHGQGPFVVSSPAANARAMQLFLIVIAIPLMALAAVMEERAQAEDQARANEERLQLALSAAQIGTWEWHIPGGTGSWSDKSKEIFGFAATPPDLSLDNFLALLSPEDRPAVSQAVHRALVDGAPYEAEFRLLRPDGEIRWVLGKGKALFDAAGRPVRLLGVNTDITERKRANAALVEWKNRYDAAVRSSNKLLYDWNAKTNQVTYGGDFEGILGYTPADLAGGLDRWTELVHPGDRAAFRAEVDRVLATDDRFQFTYRMCRKDGEVIWVEDRSRIVRDDMGQLVTMVGFVEEITERTRADQALRSSEERFAKTFQSCPDAIAISRQSDGRILEINGQWEAMFGYSRQAVIGRTPAELNMYVADAEPERLAELLAAAGRIRNFELELRAGAGEIRQAVLAADTVEMGGEPCFITFIRDITEQKRVESEAQQHRHEVAHLSRVALLGELSGALAHELNQPLTAILANARAAQRLLAAGPPVVADLREILEDIAHDDLRAGEVIHRLRALLRKEGVQPRLLDLNGVVADVLELVHSDLIQRMIDLDARLAPSLPPVLGDHVQLQQVLLNLLLNACDAMSATPRDERRLTIVTGISEEGVVQLSLADQGIGIPEEKLDQIFEPFVTTKAQGLGLGLAICRSIVAAHGGCLWAENNEHGGATFHLGLRGEEAAARA